MASLVFVITRRINKDNTVCDTNMVTPVERDITHTKRERENNKKKNDNNLSKKKKETKNRFLLVEDGLMVNGSELVVVSIFTFSIRGAQFNDNALNIQDME